MARLAARRGRLAALLAAMVALVCAPRAMAKVFEKDVVLSSLQSESNLAKFSFSQGAEVRTACARGKRRDRARKGRSARGHSCDWRAGVPRRVR